MTNPAYNPSLREEPRSQKAPLIPLEHDSSILSWLESTGRLLARDSSEFDYLDDEDPEISNLMTGEDGDAFDDDDDDDVLELEE
ncbi:hypothetical protein BST81_07770 [Leptolyngbya sp. 'hensonii']|uniref:DUF3134 domain-containing protein n=1 Tax=Leptolyngbya sp. 'hensonii' TaxID=1922337 RepID=UPI0009503404|nr:DUF3134 domain-containing protein [Leptolyngbya sp. 'hensonii']OLP19097.1 hypothetical protein BST81_07770 [Leptolyngbya sp. 'hensonii']